MRFPLTFFEQQQGNRTTGDYDRVLMSCSPHRIANFHHGFDNAILVRPYQIWMRLPPSRHHASRP